MPVEKSDLWMKIKELPGYFEPIYLTFNKKIVKQKVEIGFTGSSTFVSYDQVKALGELFDRFNVKWEIKAHHGDCIKADEIFHNECLLKRIWITVHPPLKEEKRAFCKNYNEIREAKDYLVRNHDIVDETNLLIAIPDSHVEMQRSGTWSTVRYARALKKDIYLIMPHGIIEFEKEGDKDHPESNLNFLQERDYKTK